MYFLMLCVRVVCVLVFLCVVKICLLFGLMMRCVVVFGFGIRLRMRFCLVMLLLLVDVLEGMVIVSFVGA